MANRLKDETSPYLLQHADNPVEWYPWGEEALSRAKQDDKPILLSVGYSACHWCHVMAHESFENAEIAAIMNENFVNIKVDREERPDIDAIYMQAVQALTGRGGWPMTVFLTPDGEPFYGGTYYPPDDRHGIPGFPKVLGAVTSAYRTRRDELVQSAQQLVGRIQTSALGAGEEDLTEDVLRNGYSLLMAEFDWQCGGYAPAPKFPQAMVYDFLLRYHHRSGDAQALKMVETTLIAMACGGIYDHVGGGFHRYSTDTFWLVPHFEKMLYDNALLSSLYLHAYQATNNALYRRVVEETLDYVQREMTRPDGGFYSTQDADSEGEEGKFYVWTPQEIDDVLSAEDGGVVRRYFGVTDEGNFEGRNILHLQESPDVIAQEIGLSDEELEAIVRRSREKLYEVRSKRVWPGRDEKVLTCWNGLMLRSFAEAAAVLNRDDYREVAERNATFVLERLRSNGRLLRSYKDDQAKVLGYLEDYSFFVDGLIALYEATFERRWLDEARSLADSMLELFWDEASDSFYDTGRDHESLVVRPRDLFDNATPSGSSVAVDVLLGLAVLFDNNDYKTKAASLLRALGNVFERYPNGFGRWLCAADFYLSTPKEVAIVGVREDPAMADMLRTLFSRYLPNKVVAGYRPDDLEAVTGIPLLQDKGTIADRPTAYVCENYTCQLPVAEPDALAEQLGA